MLGTPPGFTLGQDQTLRIKFQSRHLLLVNELKPSILYSFSPLAVNAFILLEVVVFPHPVVEVEFPVLLVVAAVLLVQQVFLA